MRMYKRGGNIHKAGEERGYKKDLDRMGGNIGLSCMELHDEWSLLSPFCASLENTAA
jgi:hypothetical protein